MKKSYHLRMSHFLYVLGFVFLIASIGWGQSSIRINGGDRTLTITAGIPGGELVDVINTNCSLTYYSGGRTRKITVGTACTGQSFNLSVLATTVTQGVAVGEVTLITGTIASDFITDIPSYRNGTCGLQYTASATFAQGNSTDFNNDRHRVTYTITRQ